MVIPRAFSSFSRSPSTPVNALTRAVLPWSIWPAVPMIMMVHEGSVVLDARLPQSPPATAQHEPVRGTARLKCCRRPWLAEARRAPLAGRPRYQHRDDAPHPALPARRRRPVPPRVATRPPRWPDRAPPRSRRDTASPAASWLQQRRFQPLLAPNDAPL